ncbi:MAG: MoaD/ThiS family protein [Chloroflexi bacterium]|nr:MoaD/ThiS family protein [Chloroflexota bacterium]
MNLTVEFLGLSRRLAQAKEALVTTHDRATFRDLLRILAERHPALLGPVIVPDSYDLVSAYMLNINGRRAVTDLDTPAHDGQRILLMFVEAGG